MRVLLAALLCLLAVPVVAVQVAAQGDGPFCEVVSPIPSFVEVGVAVEFHVRCIDLDGDLAFLDWSDGVRQEAEDGFDHVFGRAFRAEVVGPVAFQAVGIDEQGLTSAVVFWTLEIVPATGGGGGPSQEDLDFATGLGGVTALGGTVYGVRRYRKKKRAREGANVQAGVNTGSMAASNAGPAVGANSGTVSQGNTGTLIHGNTGTIIMQAPTAPAHAHMVPPGVPPRRHDLYRALDEAHEILDAPEGGERVIVARDMVDEVLSDLRDGKTPKSGSRAYTADAIERALEATQAPRVQAGAAALRAAAAELRK